MTVRQAYKEILEFLAAGPTADSIVKFRPSEEMQARVRELIERQKEAEISSADHAELEEYLCLEHLIVMAKATR